MYKPYLDSCLVRIVKEVVAVNKHKEAAGKIDEDGGIDPEKRMAFQMEYFHFKDQFIIIGKG